MARTPLDAELHAAIGRRLREGRLRERRSQREIGLAAGITQATLSNYERGRGQLSLVTAMRLAAAFGTSLDVLFNGVVN
ncbi:MAG: XRE family transcriptional regulator [Dehalococcoidia bacterium]|nr:XRE family transcriptional regulator [Dehalococcoidia bacterium]